MCFRALNMQPMAVSKEAILWLTICIHSLIHHTCACFLAEDRKSQRNPGCLPGQRTEEDFSHCKTEEKGEGNLSVDDWWVGSWVVLWWTITNSRVGVLPTFLPYLLPKENWTTPSLHSMRWGWGPSSFLIKTIFFHSGHPRTIACWIQVPHGCGKSLKTPDLMAWLV